MDCKHIEEKIPAYLEGVLPPDEGKRVEAHVAACPSCRVALEHLVKAGKLVRELEEAEPPPWLKQRVMARVREERERRQGFIRRFFYPLHIKVPVTALATVLVAVFAVYVFKAVEPETTYLRQAPSEPARVATEKDIPKSLAAVPLKVADPEERKERKAVTVSDRKRESEKKEVSSEARAVPLKPAEKDVAERKMASRPEAAPAVSADAAIKEAPVAKRVLSPAKGERAALGAAAKDDVRAPAMAAKIKAAPAVRPGYAFSLYATDPAAVMSDVEKILVESGARKVRREFQDGKGIVTAEIETEKEKEVIEKLKSLGEVREKDKVQEPPAGPITLKIEILSSP